jgi:hypothetical protein
MFLWYMVKVYNHRSGGDLYHYAHFLCDCVLPEFLANIHEVKGENVYRLKKLDQTLGNFSNIWEDIFNMKSIELPEHEYNKIPDKTLTIYREKMNNGRGPNVDELHKFRQYIFQRFNIDHENYDHVHYPKILLIEREERIELINDQELQKMNKNVTTGKERREIENIELLKTQLEATFQNNYKCIRLAGMKFDEQIKYFNNACMIICAHGAAMSNMLFCKPNTVIIEITCKVDWKFFNQISNYIGLIHRKCDNNVDIITKFVRSNIRHMNIKL